MVPTCRSEQGAICAVSVQTADRWGALDGNPCPLCEQGKWVAVFEVEKVGD